MFASDSIDDEMRSAFCQYSRRIYALYILGYLSEANERTTNRPTEQTLLTLATSMMEMVMAVMGDHPNNDINTALSAKLQIDRQLAN